MSKGGLILKVAIIGSRDFVDYDFLKKNVDEIINRIGQSITLVVSGGAKGADSLAERYADEKKIEKKIIEADWEKYGKKAGILRNTSIINNSDIVIAFWDYNSHGTKDSINKAKQKGKEVFIVDTVLID